MTHEPFEAHYTIPMVGGPGHGKRIHSHDPSPHIVVPVRTELNYWKPEPVSPVNHTPKHFRYSLKKVLVYVPSGIPDDLVASHVWKHPLTVDVPPRDKWGTKPDWQYGDKL